MPPAMVHRHQPNSRLFTRPEARLFTRPEARLFTRLFTRPEPRLFTRPNFLPGPLRTTRPTRSVRLSNLYAGNRHRLVHLHASVRYAVSPAQKPPPPSKRRYCGPKRSGGPLPLQRRRGGWGGEGGCGKGPRCCFRSGSRFFPARFPSCHPGRAS